MDAEHLKGKVVGAGVKLLKRLNELEDKESNDAAMQRVCDAYMAALTSDLQTPLVRNAFYTGLMLGIPFTLDGEKTAIEMLPGAGKEVPA